MRPRSRRDAHERCRVRSIIGHCLPELMEDYPELEGFDLPTVAVPFTAVNKLNALHRRAATLDTLTELAARIQDVHDLGAVAANEHATKRLRHDDGTPPALTATARTGPLQRQRRGDGATRALRRSMAKSAARS